VTETTADPDHLLAQCLDQIDAGHLTVEEASRAYAHLGPEFAELLQLAVGLRRLRDRELPPATKQAIRGQLLRRMCQDLADQPQVVTPLRSPDVRSGPARWMGRLVIAALTASLLVAGLNWTAGLRRLMTDHLVTPATLAGTNEQDLADGRSPGVPSNRGGRPILVAAIQIEATRPARLVPK
jgi:hypothetical protein